MKPLYVLILTLLSFNAPSLSLKVTDQYGTWHALHAPTSNGPWAWGVAKTTQTDNRAIETPFTNEPHTLFSPAFYLYESRDHITEIDYYFYSGTGGDTYICSGHLYYNQKPEIDNHGGCHLEISNIESQNYKLVLNASGPSLH